MKNKKEIQKNIEEFAKELDQYAIENFNAYKCDQGLIDSLLYSFVGGGKKLRPFLFKCAIENHNLDYKKYMNFALAVEMIHVSSLIHDDLPGMDNDDYRRGKLTNHKKFGEATAIIAGDTLLAHGFGEFLNTSELPLEKMFQLIQLAVDHAGVNNGLISGQYLDIKNSDRDDITLELLEQINAEKTARLFQLPLMAAEIIAETNNEEEIKAIGQEFGAIFQIVNDYLDYYEGDRSDEKNCKLTYVNFYTKSELKKLIKERKNKLMTRIKNLDERYQYLADFLDFL